MSNPFQVVADFEAALARYTCAPYCVTTTSCTMALLLAVAYQLRHTPPQVDEQHNCLRVAQIEIPKRTYVGVPMSIIHAGARPTFRDQEWSGAYRLDPLPIWDSARRLRANMSSYATCWNPQGNDDAPSLNGEMVCLSFHWSKVLGIEQGGAILHSNPTADLWLRKARFDGRTEGVPPDEDTFDVLGYHAYMSPETAAAGLVRLNLLRGGEPDLPNSDYPDLSTMAIFK